MKITIEETDKKLTMELSECLLAHDLLNEFICIMLAMGYMQESVNEAVINLAQEAEEYQKHKEI